MIKLIVQGCNMRDSRKVARPPVNIISVQLKKQNSSTSARNHTLWLSQPKPFDSLLASETVAVIAVRTLLAFGMVNCGRLAPNSVLDTKPEEDRRDGIGEESENAEAGTASAASSAHAENTRIGIVLESAIFVVFVVYDNITAGRHIPGPKIPFSAASVHDSHQTCDLPRARDALEGGEGPRLPRVAGMRSPRSHCCHAAGRPGRAEPRRQ